MAMPAYLGGRYQMAGMKWYGSNMDNKAEGASALHPHDDAQRQGHRRPSGPHVREPGLLPYRTGGIPGVGAQLPCPQGFQGRSHRGAWRYGQDLRCRRSWRRAPRSIPSRSRAAVKRSLDSFVSFVKSGAPADQDRRGLRHDRGGLPRQPTSSRFTTTVRRRHIHLPAQVERFLDQARRAHLHALRRPASTRSSCCTTASSWSTTSKLYDAWEEEYPYPTYPQDAASSAAAFTDLVPRGQDRGVTDIVNIADIIENRRGPWPHLRATRTSSSTPVGGMPVEDIAWGGTVYRNAVEKGIGVKLNLWDTPEMA